MTVAFDFSHRSSSNGGATSAMSLEDRFEVIKDIGDGSFGSVVLARVRTAGANVARRGSVVAIKTMKKTFESFSPCLELREVIFLRTLPVHPHLVPALEIFLDPTTKKLHICMEYMDGNLYQLMKARDHKCLDPSSVKSILFQILAGLDHIHANNFFHRDIKPENILVSTSAPHESGMTFRRYSALVTPPTTPPNYTIKIADFGLARETHSKSPFTTYVSTRWYRAPEVLLRAGEYSAPVDIWAIGAMAVEIATLKPLFPGGNEVDQVWRVCEIMGSPGNWYNKFGSRVGGGDWREGTRLAQKLGFSFPKMAPHSMETILQPPHWPTELSNFVTWCLMWDPKNRPTSAQAMSHEYFADATDPLRPKSSTTRLLSRKQSGMDYRAHKDPSGTPTLSSKASWFRKSLITRESAPAVPLHSNASQILSPRPSPVHSNVSSEAKTTVKPRPFAAKRATWAIGTTPTVGAPMPILPSIRPISPLSDAVTAQASSRLTSESTSQGANIPLFTDNKTSKKIGRQLSVASSGNHYADIHRQEAERALNGNGIVVSPISGQKEGFFSHLRKRARRLSGRHQIPLSPNLDDVEANAGCGPLAGNRSSMIPDPHSVMDTASKTDFTQLDRALQNVRYSLETSTTQQSLGQKHGQTTSPTNSATYRQYSLPQGQAIRSVESPSPSTGTGPISSRTRRALQLSTHPAHRYETPDEEDELLDEALNGAYKAAAGVDSCKRAEDRSTHGGLEIQDVKRKTLHRSSNHALMPNPYPTPSPSAKRSGVLFDETLMGEPATPLTIKKQCSQEDNSPEWPTPPYEENGWAAAASASIFAAGSIYQ
ncbi:cmgc rck mak protein kinase [Lasallia pustulata]|uniref:Cmgc rck mak protein kinase n=1 Tax=Lasallia pustulata TaxID=136370 RepID=A0A1W5CYG3_9LECA|nr:cmgc rck mak protein kinase [Lasallia pustulata]